MSSEEKPNPPGVAPPPVPGALRLVFMLLFAPRRLWGRMVRWNLDGDPCLLALLRDGGAPWPKRAWARQMLAIQLGPPVLTAGLTLAQFGWRPGLVLLVLYGAAFSVALAVFVGMAFGAAVALSEAVTILSIEALPAQLLGHSTSSVVVAFCCGFTVRVGLEVSEVLLDAEDARSGGERSFLDRVSIFVPIGVVLALAFFEHGAWGRLLVGAAFACGLCVGLLSLFLRRRLTPFGFLNYRHDDADAARLADAIHEALPHCTFLDKVEIPSGSAWQNELIAALDRATVLLAMFGAGVEAGTADEQGRGRHFWIEFERGYARRCFVPIVPTSDVPGATIPGGLAGHQALLGSLDGILDRLESEHGLRRAASARDVESA